MAQVRREREVTLDCPAEFVMPDLTSLGSVTPQEPLTLTATYFDTLDLRLARWGVTLRRRTGGKDDAWTFKFPDEGTRLEVTLPLTSGTTPPAELKALAAAFSRGLPLRKAATIVTRRRAMRVDASGAEPLAEITIDEVHARSPLRGASSWWELEVEALTPDVDLSAFTARLQAGGAHARVQPPEAIRVFGPAATMPGDPPPPSHISRRDPCGLLVEHALRTHTRSLVLQDSRVRLNLDDSVHQMRVASRCLHSAVRTLQPLLVDTWAIEVGSELTWLAGSLGTARDAEVGLALAREVLDHVGASESLHEVVTGAYSLEDSHATAVRTLADKRWLRLLNRLVDAAYDPPLRDLASQPLREVAPDLVGATWRRLAGRVDRLGPHSPDVDYHRVRVLAKRARYAMETVAPAYGKGATRFASVITEVQDVLGDHQDCAVVTAALRGIATRDGLGQQHASVLGRAVQTLADREMELRGAFHKLWPEVRRGRHQRWLRSSPTAG